MFPVIRTLDIFLPLLLEWNNKIHTKTGPESDRLTTHRSQHLPYLSSNPFLKTFPEHRPGEMKPDESGCPCNENGIVDLNAHANVTIPGFKPLDQWPSLQPQLDTLLPGRDCLRLSQNPEWALQLPSRPRSRIFSRHPRR